MSSRLATSGIGFLIARRAISISDIPLLTFGARPYRHEGIPPTGETMKNWANIGDALAGYVDSNWLRESSLRRRLREETAKMPRAGMQISTHQGQQISLLARAIGARQ